MKAYLPNYIKSKNREIVFDMFLEKHELSRAEIARQTNMSFPTVLKVVESLLVKNIIVESGDMVSAEEGAGRKSRVLVFNPDAYRAIGVEFEGKFANVGLVNLKGDVIEKETISLDNFTQTCDLSVLSKCINGIIARNPASPILGVCMGFPANINPDNKSIVSYTSINIWKETPFDEIFHSFSDDVSIPVFLENDVNQACVGESFLRQKQGAVTNLLYLSLGTGCGAGIIMDGKLRRGTHFKSGEIGNMILDRNDFEKLDSQPNGTFEKLINIDTINRVFHVNLRSGVLLDGEIKNAIVDYLAPYICSAIFNLITILDIDEFILAGIIPEVLGEPFYEKLNKKINRILNANESVVISPPVNHSSGIIGGAVTVFNRMIFEVLKEE